MRSRYRRRVSSLRLALLGPPRVELDGAPIQFDTRKAIALLTVLAVRGEAQSRDALAALLWPEHDGAHAGGALRRTLSVTRAGIGSAGLRLQGRSVALAPSVHVDLERLHAITEGVARHHPHADPVCDRCLRRLAEIPKLVRGRFLEGFGLRDSPEFDDWSAATAEAIDREVADALDRLSDGFAGRGRTNAALEAAHRRLAIDPLNEETHRRLMRLHAGAGDRSGAIARYRDCVQVLDRELGVAPMPETTELYDRITAGPAAASPDVPTPTAAWPAAGISSLPLTGRQADLHALLGACRQPGRQGRLVLLEGEPGIGKTRLLDEVAEAVRDSGARILALIAHDGEQAIPYAPIVGALERIIAAGDIAWLEALPGWARAELARVVPTAAQPGGAVAAIEGPGAEIRFTEGLSRSLLVAAGASRGGMICLDDLQWADSATVGVIGYLARRVADAGCCLVLARRPPEPDQDPIAELLRAARRRGTLVEVRPGRLNREEVAALARAAGASIDADRLFAETEGIPFFVAEYLAAAAEPGAAAAGTDLTPRPIRELLSARIEGLDAATRQVLVAAAVVGRSFEPELVRATSGRSPEETATAIEELLARRLITESAAPDGTPRYDFDHAKTREVAYASASLARRRLLHRRAALALLQPAMSRRDGHAAAATVARHLRECGDDRGAARHLRIAGDEAAAIYAHADALDLYRSALALDPEAAGPLHERIGDESTRLGRYDDAVAAYEAAAAAAGTRDAWRIEQRIADVHGRRGEWPLAEAHLGAALMGLPSGALADRARATADRALVAHRRGDERRSGRLAREALQLAVAADDPACRAQAHNLLGILARSAGHLTAARRHLDESLALASAANLEEARIAALNNLALVQLAAGRAQDAAATSREALEAALTIGDRHREAAIRNNLADALHAAGRRDEALDELRQAVAIFAEVGRPGGMEPEIWKLVDW
jgi:DNA-binding SARP family transcriptional activator/tetratricopeptide (TPR) repeat protein